MRRGIAIGSSPMRATIRQAARQAVRQTAPIAFFAAAGLLGVSTLAVTTHSARAHDDGRYANSPLHGWFEQLASGRGPCCSFADGASIADVDWDTQGPGGHYRVRLHGQWIEVPDAAVVHGPNRDGRAFVWPYTDVRGKTQIRCFLPGAGA
jgi:hypothetical protein